MSWRYLGNDKSVYRRLRALLPLAISVICFTVAAFGQTQYIITKIAGTFDGTYNSGDGGLAVNAAMNYPTSVGLDNAGNVYVLDSQNARIRKVDTNGIITTVAGGGTADPQSGAPATEVNLGFFGESSLSLFVDGAGDVYLGVANLVYKIDSSGAIANIAGGGIDLSDRIPAAKANLGSVNALTMDRTGNLYIVCQDGRLLRKIDTSGIVTTIAGSTFSGYSGDGGSATQAYISASGIAVDASGAVYIADEGNYRIRKVSGGIITTVAGNGMDASTGDGGQATSASIVPHGIAVDANGNLYSTDQISNTIRKITPAGVITTIAGAGDMPNVYDGVPANSVYFAEYGTGPAGIVLAPGGRIYFTDMANCRIDLLTPVPGADNSAQPLIFTNPYAGFVFSGGQFGPVSSGDAAKAMPAQAFIADGVSAAVAVFRSSSNDPVMFQLDPGSPASLTPYDPNFLTDNPSTGTNQPVTLTPSFDDGSGNYTFLAMVWPPQTMPVANPGSGQLPSMQINVTAVQDSTSSGAPLSLLPPPLLLVHGVWSSALQAGFSPFSSPPGFFSWISARYPHRLIYPVDYGQYSALSFDSPPIQSRLAEAMASAFNDTAQQNVVARTVDVVGHSMGGLVTRYYLGMGSQNAAPYLASNPVHKLITIGTPHLGSNLAAQLLLHQNDGLAEVSPLAAIACGVYLLPRASWGACWRAWGRASVAARSSPWRPTPANSRQSASPLVNLPIAPSWESRRRPFPVPVHC